MPIETSKSLSEIIGGLKNGGNDSGSNYGWLSDGVTGFTDSSGSSDDSSYGNN